MTEKAQNPFRPIFGKTPPILIDRGSVIEDYIASLDSYQSDERITTLFVGQCGIGKTVVLNEISKQIGEKDWIGVDVSMSESLLDNIYDRLRIEARERLSARKSKLTGVNVNVMGFGAGISTETGREDFSTMTKIALIVEELTKKNVGVVFIISVIYTGSGGFGWGFSLIFIMPLAGEYYNALFRPGFIEKTIFLINMSTVNAQSS
jgi:hypothetical protein